MTDSEEAAFVDHLAAQPEDETARLAYADWLDEHERPEEAARQRKMAPGHRALARHGREPFFNEYDRPFVTDGAPLTPEQHARREQARQRYEWWRWGASVGAPYARSRMPEDWFGAVESPYYYRNQGGMQSKDYITRGEAVDAAALAFADLPPARQAELLAAPPEELT